MKTNKITESFILPTRQQNCQDDTKWGSGGEMANIPLSEDAIREIIKNTLPNFAHNATRNLQTSTINLQFYEATKIRWQAHLSEFVRFINEKKIFSQRACSTENFHVTGEVKTFLIPHLHSWNISNFGRKHVLQSVLKVHEPWRVLPRRCKTCKWI